MAIFFNTILIKKQASDIVYLSYKAIFVLILDFRTNI